MQEAEVVKVDEFRYLRSSIQSRARYSGYIGRRRLKLPGRRKRGPPERRFKDVMKEDMRRAGVTEEDARDREEPHQREH